MQKFVWRPHLTDTRDRRVLFGDIKIAPSILSGNFMDMAKSVKQIEDAGAQWVHIDVMDGHFVPNLTIGVPFVAQMRAITNLPLDVHLMISNPLVQIPWFIDAGADSITFHLEATTTDEANAAIDMIHEGKLKAAISIKPKTSVDVIEPFIDKVDMVLIMSVEPGFSGQSYIEGSEDKVSAVVEMAKRHSASPLIQVDGGISLKTAPYVCSAGADVLVCGNSFFGASDKATQVQEITSASNIAQAGALNSTAR